MRAFEARDPGSNPGRAIIFDSNPWVYVSKFQFWNVARNLFPTPNPGRAIPQKPSRKK